MAETASPRFLRPLAAPGADIGQAIAFDLSHPLALDSGRTLSPFTVAYMTYGTLNAEIERRAGLPCADGDQFAAEPPSRDRQARLVGPPDRAGQAHRYRPLLRDLRQCASAAAWARPGRRDRSRDRRALRPELSARHRRDMVRAQAMLLDALGIEKSSA
jgi:homoserine O-acetyltransferase